VFNSGVKHEVFDNTKGRHAITHERYMGTLLTKVTQCICDPKQLWAITSGRDIFGFCGKTNKQARNPKTSKYLKSISNQLDTPRSRHPKNQEVKGKMMWSTKDRAQECIEDTWRSAWWPANVKSSSMPENECTGTRKTACPALSLSSTRGCRSCSGTPSGPRALHPRPRQAL
jgi:hypothetical protein